MKIIESNIGYWELWEVLVTDRGTQFGNDWTAGAQMRLTGLITC